MGIFETWRHDTLMYFRGNFIINLPEALGNFCFILFLCIVRIIILMFGHKYQYAEYKTEFELRGMKSFSKWQKYCLNNFFSLFRNKASVVNSFSLHIPIWKFWNTITLKWHRNLVSMNFFIEFAILISSTGNTHTLKNRFTFESYWTIKCKRKPLSQSFKFSRGLL